jgi:hypothetical protein
LAFALLVTVLVGESITEVLYTLVSPNEEASGYFGGSVSGAGDVNGDGYDDVVLGAYGESPSSNPNLSGRSYVFDGQTGNALHTVVSPNEEVAGFFGYSVSGAGDVNMDGYDDVLIGAKQENPGSSPDSAGRAYIFSGILIPVELTSFTASMKDAGVFLRWTTLSEHENFGFHLYRSREPADQYLRITDAVISGAGNSSVRHDYSYVDENVSQGCHHSYKLADVDFQGRMIWHGPVSVTSLPTEFRVSGAFPNPFSSKATVKLHLSAQRHVRLSIYDVVGYRVRTLVDTETEAGQHEISWDGRDDSGGRVSPGVYTVRAQSADREYLRILIRIR